MSSIRLSGSCLLSNALSLHISYLIC